MPTAASLRSSFFANRPRAALWIAVVVAVVALIVAVVVGFRSHPAKKPTSRRTVVAVYIIRVGRIQVGMSTQIKAIDKQYRLFAKDPRNLGKRVGTYRAAERTLARLRARLAAAKPPREARRLHALLLELADQNIIVARSVTGLAAYLPQMAKEQAALRPALVALRNRIRAAKRAALQAAAFDDYAAVTRGVAERVQRVRAPAFFVAARNTEAARLRSLSSLATQIADALRQKKLKLAQTLVGRLGLSQSQTAVVRAQRAGALAYNASLEKISRLAKQIDAERQRLEKRVPA